MAVWERMLYNYGFLLTDDENACCVDIDWNTWQKRQIRNYVLYLHPALDSFVCEAADTTFLLVGHAYNPFTMEADENEILKHASRVYRAPEYRDYIDQLTGMFFFAVIESEKITAISDCAGQFGAYYAKINGYVYFSSYSQLIADIHGLPEDEYVSMMKKSKLFHLYGWFLPGNLSPYKEIRRIMPNTETIYDGIFSIKRFYPRETYTVVSDAEYDNRVKKIGEIIHNSMYLITKKWEKPAISLTGGTDSQTTLACAGDIQDHFVYFSYISLPREGTDAQAARTICDTLGLKHEIYDISTEKNDYPDYEQVDNLIERHYSYLGKGNSNDICKRIALSNTINFDVEVKSWVSEIARASRSKMYGKKEMPSKMTARRLTTMYKVFALNRRDAINTDNIFRRYIRDTGLKDALDASGYPWSEMFVWEIVFGGWGSLALTGEHRLSNDVTIPYNNRALLDLMLRTPHEKRRTDQLHRDIIQYMDKRISDMNIHVVNGNETKIRTICEKIYFNVHSYLPW